MEMKKEEEEGLKRNERKWKARKKRELVIFIETPLRGLCVSKLLLENAHTGPYPMPSIY